MSWRWQVLWICQLVVYNPVYSLHGVWPTAPQAWIQSSQVQLELGQAEIVDLLLVVAAVAARHQWKNVSYERKMKIEKTKNQLFEVQVLQAHSAFQCFLRSKTTSLPSQIIPTLKVKSRLFPSDPSLLHQASTDKFN